MTLLELQIFAALSIFLLSLFAGLLPNRLLQHHQTLFTLSDAWASGIFLGAALFHMYPDADISFRQLYPNLNYPLASLICMIGFLFLLMVERSVVRVSHFEFNNDKNNPITAIVLLVVLSIHSLIEGSALGVNTIFNSAIVIYFAILAHKGSASFALAVNLHRTSLSKRTIKWFIILFSFMTPIGIGVASALEHILELQSATLMTAVFNALAAGTFLYIGMRHLLEEKYAEYKPKDQLKEFTAALFGIVLMAVLAIWL